MSQVKKRWNKEKTSFSWQIDYFDPTGKRVRKSFKTKKEAAAELGKRVSLIAEGRYLDVKKECKIKLGELLDKYSENFRNQASYITGKQYYMKNFRKHFGEETLISNIRYYDLESYRNYLQEKTVRGQKRRPSSVNREIATLRHIFSKAKEWELIEENPFDKGRSLHLKENNQRLRFLNADEITALLDECRLPYLKDIVVSAINTGMRKGEILSLKWDQIRNGFIYLTKTKTQNPRQIPVNDTLNIMFKRIRRQQHLRSPYVFTLRGERIKHIKGAFKTALRRADVVDFRFHDLRHTFASQLIMKGGTLKDVQELLGHKTMQMTMRYAHLSQEHKRKAVNLLNGLTGNAMSQTCHKRPFSTKTAINVSI